MNWLLFQIYGVRRPYICASSLTCCFINTLKMRINRKGVVLNIFWLTHDSYFEENWKIFYCTKVTSFDHDKHAQKCIYLFYLFTTLERAWGLMDNLYKLFQQCRPCCRSKGETRHCGDSDYHVGGC